jgi:hypothetical protein
MKKPANKSNRLGRHHADSLKRNAYDKGPKPAKGHYPSLGSSGKPEPEKKK